MPARPTAAVFSDILISATYNTFLGYVGYLLFSLNVDDDPQSELLPSDV